jgi:hypothetical protein
LIGLFQAGAFAAMTMYFPRDVVTGPGAAFVFLLYVCQVGFIVTSAAVCLVINLATGASGIRTPPAPAAFPPAAPENPPPP